MSSNRNEGVLIEPNVNKPLDEAVLSWGEWVVGVLVAIGLLVGTLALIALQMGISLDPMVEARKVSNVQALPYVLVLAVTIMLDIAGALALMFLKISSTRRRSVERRNEAFQAMHSKPRLEAQEDLRQIWFPILEARPVAGGLVQVLLYARGFGDRWVSAQFYLQDEAERVPTGDGPDDSYEAICFPEAEIKFNLPTTADSDVVTPVITLGSLVLLRLKHFRDKSQWPVLASEPAPA